MIRMTRMVKIKVMEGEGITRVIRMRKFRKKDDKRKKNDGKKKDEKKVDSDKSTKIRKS